MYPPVYLTRQNPADFPCFALWHVGCKLYLCGAISRSTATEAGSAEFERSAVLPAFLARPRPLLLLSIHLQARLYLAAASCRSAPVSVAVRKAKSYRDV